MIVIDASAAIALLLTEDSKLASVDQLLALAVEPLVAPSHWAAEVGNALVINVRRRRLEPAQFALMIGRLAALGIEIAPPPSYAEIAMNAQYAIETGLTYYDSAYIQMAMTKQAALFTLDGKMREVAARVNIPVLPR